MKEYLIEFIFEITQPFVQYFVNRFNSYLILIIFENIRRYLTNLIKKPEEEKEMWYEIFLIELSYATKKKMKERSNEKKLTQQ